MNSTNSRPVVFETYVTGENKSNNYKTVQDIDKLNSIGKVSTNNTLHANEKTLEKRNQSVQNVESASKLDSVKNISKLFENKLTEYKTVKAIETYKDLKHAQTTNVTNPSKLSKKFKSFENRFQSNNGEIKENTPNVLKNQVNREEQSNTITVTKDPNSSLQFKIPILSKGENEIKIAENKPELRLQNASKWLEVKVDITYRDEAKTPVNNEGVIQAKSDKGNENFTTRSYNGFANDTHQEGAGKGNVEPVKENFIAKENSIDVKSLVNAFQRSIEENVDARSNTKRTIKRKEDKNELDKADDLQETAIKNVKSIKGVDLILEENNNNFVKKEKVFLPTVEVEKENESRSNVIIKKENEFIGISVVDKEKKSLPTSSVKETLMKLRNVNRNESTQQPPLSVERELVLEKESPSISPILKKTTRFESSEVARPSFKHELQSRVSRIEISSENVRQTADELELKDISFQHELKEYDTKGKNKSEPQNLNGKSSVTDATKFTYIIGKKSKEEEITDWTRVEEIVFKTEEEKLADEKKQEQSKKQNQISNIPKIKPHSYNTVPDVGVKRLGKNIPTMQNGTVENHFSEKIKEVPEYEQETKESSFRSDLNDYIKKHVKKTNDVGTKLPSDDFSENYTEISFQHELKEHETKGKNKSEQQNPNGKISHFKEPDPDYYEEKTKESSVQRELNNYIRNHVQKVKDGGTKIPSDDILNSSMLEHDWKLSHGATRIRKTQRPSLPNDFMEKTEQGSMEISNIPQPDYN